MNERGTAKRFGKILILMAAFAIPFYAQATSALLFAHEAPDESAQPSTDRASTSATAPSEPTTEQVAQTQQTDASQTVPRYVFPTRRERFKRYVKSTVGPVSLIHTTVSAGINQWRDNPEEWEQGASGYGKRFASSFGRTAIQQSVSYGLDSALGLDTGFKKSQRKGFVPRMKDGLAANITSRTRSGKRVISVPRISGVYASAIISHETWYPERYNYKDGLRSGTGSLITGFGLNLIREFVISW